MYLVTGGAGFIGSNVVSALGRRGMAVTVCDRLRDHEKWRNLAKATIVDIVSPDGMLEWLGQRPHLEGVIHLGAISSTTVTDADLVFDVNVRLSRTVWTWCSEHGVPLIYASSAATYGDGNCGFDDDNEPDALARLRPLNAYGWSKHVFDREVLRRVGMGEKAPPQWVGLKFFNVFGPNEYHKGPMQSVVAQKFPLVASGQPITLFTSHDSRYADGGQLRDFIYVDDCVDVILWLLDHRNVSGLYNLGTGTARSFLDVANALSLAAGVPNRVEFVPMPEAIRPNYQYFTQARMERLRAAGYSRSFTSLENGVGQYVERYLSCQDRYR